MHFSIHQKASFCGIRGYECEAIDLRRSTRVSVCYTQILNVLLGEITACDQWMTLQEQLAIPGRLEHFVDEGGGGGVGVRQEQDIRR